MLEESAGIVATTTLPLLLQPILIYVFILLYLTKIIIKLNVCCFPSMYLQFPRYLCCTLVLEVLSE